MITKLDVRSNQGGFLSFPLADDSSGYIVENIEGLGPVKVTLVSSKFAQQDGAQYQASQRDTRNILLKIGLEPDYTTGDTVQALRSRLYSVFMPKMAVDLSFLLDDEQQLDISGRVESCEPTIFDQEPAVDISVMCFDPDFVDPIVVVQNGVTTAGSNSSNFTYQGTVDSGILFQIMPNRNLSEFTIYQQASDGGLRSMDFQAPLVDGDTVTISTISGAKFANLTRADADSSILYGVDPQANWLQLTPGANAIRVYAEGDPVPYTIQYSKRYGGL